MRAAPEPAAAEFRRRFGVSHERAVFAPGRVNLLGGHVDYNQGRVLPVAISRGVWALSRRTPRGVRLATTASFEGEAPPLTSLGGPQADLPSWARLFAAAARGFGPARGLGLDVLLVSDLPVGGGLSSSAASAVAFLATLADACGQRVGALELAQRVQAAERDGLGVRCGLMDPLASAAGRVGQVIDLDCRDGAYAYRPLPADRASIVVVPTPTQRRLAGSAYNARRAACERVVAALRATDPRLRSLREATVADVEAAAVDAADRGYARHVVEEMARVEAGRSCLDAGDLEGFGALIYASHDSLRDLYAVSTPELDRIVEVCRAAPESFGGRVTGAGFGGCTVHLVRAGREAEFCARLPGAWRLATADGPG